MARPVTTLVVFFVAFNLLAGVLMSTGAAAALGMDTTVGGDDAVDKRVNQADDVSTGSGLGDTLFGMYNVLSSQIGNFFGVIFPGLEMVERAGVPGFITDGILAPLFGIAIFVDVVSFLRGWGL